MKAVKINLAGAERYLVFTGEAMFRFREEFGELESLIDSMKLDTREGLAVLASAAAILAEQGELARRHMGYSKTPIVEAEDIISTITPEKMLDLKVGIIKAINLGFGREVEDDDQEVDLGLAELNSQKKTT